MRYLKKKELVNTAIYWVRLPQDAPNGKLSDIVLKSISGETVSMDLACDNNPYRNVQTFQFNTVDFIERIL